MSWPELLFRLQKEPTRLARSDGRCPGGVTLILQKSGKYLAWNTTVIDTLVESYRARSAEVVGATVNISADRKHSNALPPGHHIVLQFITNGKTYVICGLCNSVNQ